MPDVHLGGDAKGVLQPGLREGTFGVAQLVGDHRLDHADVLLVKLEDVWPECLQADVVRQRLGHLVEIVTPDALDRAAAVLAVQKIPVLVAAGLAHFNPEQGAPRLGPFQPLAQRVDLRIRRAAQPGHKAIVSRDPRPRVCSAGRPACG